MNWYVPYIIIVVFAIVIVAPVLVTNIYEKLK